MLFLSLKRHISEVRSYFYPYLTIEFPALLFGNANHHHQPALMTKYTHAQRPLVYLNIWICIITFLMNSFSSFFLWTQLGLYSQNRLQKLLSTNLSAFTTLLSIPILYPKANHIIDIHLWPIQPKVSFQLNHVKRRLFNLDQVWRVFLHHLEAYFVNEENSAIEIIAGLIYPCSSNSSDDLLVPMMKKWLEEGENAHGANTWEWEEQVAAWVRWVGYCANYINQEIEIIRLIHWYHTKASLLAFLQPR